MILHTLATAATAADDSGSGNGLAIGLFVIIGVVALWKWAGHRDSTNRLRADLAHEYQTVIGEYNLNARAAGRPDYWIADQERYGAGDTAWQLACHRVATRAQQLDAIEGRVRSARREGFAQGYIGKTYDN